MIYYFLAKMGRGKIFKKVVMFDKKRIYLSDFSLELGEVVYLFVAKKTVSVSDEIFV